MAITILEMAANVRQKSEELNNTCSELRRCGGDWTGLAIAREEALRIADDGLRNCYAMLERLNCIAVGELQKIPTIAT
jgi:hypothetical protein